MGGKTSRACDNCIKKRARWYCPADDAFLCQNCDASVHSANPLARRHERVRLKTSSLKELSSSVSDDYLPDLESPVSVLSVTVPSWHRGFTRKARTPRQGRKASKSAGDEDVVLKNPIHLVPEILSDENSHDDNEEEQLLYRVPTFDPFMDELCNSMTLNNHMTAATTTEIDSEFKLESKDMILQDDICKADLNKFHTMLPSEMELAEFTADVESLLGKGLDDESFDMEGLGLLVGCKSKGENSMDCSMVNSHEKVKIEDGGGMEVFTKTTYATTHDLQLGHTHHDIDINGDTFEFKFDYDSPMNISGEDEVVVKNISEDIGVVIGDGGDNNNNNNKISLNLDYEGVLTAWADQRSPWTNGERPELDSNDSWPDCMGNYMGVMNEHATVVDKGREARVLRYREKRRTRLFSKKIRYEVRKLNAEKRPRMKGRFVKKANFPTTTTTPSYPMVK
ncbi:unnamed protein product [Withania somnifera]